MNDIAELRETVERFCRFIESLPPQAKVEQEWGPKEVLAHLVFHHRVYLSQIEATIVGVEPVPPEGTFRELNAKAVSASRSVPIEDLLKSFKEVNSALCELYDVCDARNIILEMKRGVKPRTLTQLLPEIEAHIRNHLRKLEREYMLA